MNHLEFVRQPFKRRRILITVLDQGKEVGTFDYLPPASSGMPVDLGFLFVDNQLRRSGIGTALVREIVADVGKGIKVKTVIAHEPSVDILEHYNPNSNSALEIPLTITDLGIIEALPVSEVLRLGGIQLYRLHILYNPQMLRERTSYGIRRVRARGFTI